MSRRKSIECHRGEDVEITFTLDEDVTGLDLTLVLLASESDAEPLLSLTVGDGLTITEPTVVVANLSADDLDVTPTTYIYSLSLSEPGQHGVLAYGPLTILSPRAF
jgi:hypothetical protein